MRKIDKSLHDGDPDITDRLRDAIINRQEFDAGAPLRIDALATRFGVSHMPIRAALQRLESEGLIVAQPNKGARVAAVDETFVAELLDVRMLIESYLARRAAGRMTPQRLEQLETLRARHEEAVARGDAAEALTANRDFHAAIHHIAANRDASLILERHWRLIRALWKRYGYQADRFAGVVADHRLLLAAFAAGDGEAAAAVTAAHTARAKLVLLNRMREHAPPADGSQTFDAATKEPHE
ncbi:GntR family transcriptional regulator [Sodalis sp. RH14]|uniref:GntR family transcriptional regulator n=1 Tax=Sodalis sp. RH14 TaxID=3394329 RepID=UPI0039B42A42